MRKQLVSALVIAALAVPALAQMNAEDFLKQPQFVSHYAKPVFKVMTGEEARDGMRVTSTRGNALFGFNMPAVTIYLPPVANSNYAKVEFSEAKLVDKRGGKVRYAPEKGFDNDDMSYDFRFGTDDPNRLIEYATAAGTIRVTYPISVKTISAKKKDKKSLTAAGVEIDGPFVKYVTSGREVGEENGFPAFGGSVRAFDAAGKAIKRAFYSGFESSGDLDYKRNAFNGVVESVELDVIEKWAVVDIAYELTPAAKLPDSKAGMTMHEQFPDLPGAKVTKTLLAADEARAAVIPESVRQRLAELDYHDITEENFVRAATEGDIEACRLFLDAGLPADSQGSSGRTPLLAAAITRNVDIVKLLAERGANVNAKDQNGSTALLWLAQHCAATPTIKLLIEKGADVNAKAKGGGTPLMLAKALQCPANEKLLKEHGAK